MSHALRTTLILGAFWLVVILGGVYLVHVRLGKAEQKLIVQEKQLREKLEIDEDLVANRLAFQEELEAIKDQWDNRSKMLPKAEKAYETYDFIDKIITEQPTSLDFDYLSAERSDTNGVQYANYNVKGEGQFSELYRFIWFLEHQPRYLRINSLQLFENPGQADSILAARHQINFDMSMTAPAADRPEFSEVKYVPDLTAPSAIYDPFKSQLQPKRSAEAATVLPPNTRGLPDIVNSQLRALTPTHAYIADQNGKLKILRIGDEVYLGRLTDIIPEEKRIVFTLDQMRPTQQVSLQIRVRE